MKRSGSIVNLVKSLSQFQGEVHNPKNNSKNPQYNSEYADLGEVLNTVRPIMAKFGLSLTQDSYADEKSGKVIVDTYLFHESGEYMQYKPMIIPAYQRLKGGGTEYNAQAVGAAMTYARRYAISSILGISSQSDDDGNLVSGRDNKRNEEEPPKIEITGAMCEALDKLAQSKGYTHDEIIRIIQQRYNKDEYKYLTAREYATLKNSIEKAKAKNPKPEPDPQPDPPKDPNGGKPIESIDPEDGFTPDPEDIPPYDEGDIPPVLQSDENAAAPVPPEKATPDPSEGKKEDKSLSQAKINKLMAISASKGMTEAELKSLIKDMFKKSSRKNLSEDEYKLLIATIEARPEKVINLDKARENKEVVEVGFMHKGTMKITVVKDPWLLDKYRCDPDFEEIK